MNGKICIGSGLAAALIGQGVCRFTIGINFLGQLLTISGLALAGYGFICLPGINKRWPRAARLLRRFCAGMLLALFVSFVGIQGLLTIHSYSRGRALWHRAFGFAAISARDRTRLFGEPSKGYGGVKWRTGTGRRYDRSRSNAALFDSPRHRS